MGLLVVGCGGKSNGDASNGSVDVGGSAGAAEGGTSSGGASGDGTGGSGGSSSGATGGSSSGATGGSGGSNVAGAGGSASGAPAAPERCYLIDGESDSARLERNESGVYSVIESTFQTWNFDEARQELTLWRGTGVNGRYSLKVLLAADATVAAARFVECTDMPQQNACYEVALPVPAVVNDCDGAPVIVDSAAGCYDEYGGGFRVVLRGDPNHYDALVSEDGGSEVEWATSFGVANPPERTLFVMAPLGGGLTFTIGSTHRIAALATFTPDGPGVRRFVVCADGK